MVICLLSCQVDIFVWWIVLQAVRFAALLGLDGVVLLNNLWIFFYCCLVCCLGCWLCQYLFFDCYLIDYWFGLVCLLFSLFGFVFVVCDALAVLFVYMGVQFLFVWVLWSLIVYCLFYLDLACLACCLRLFTLDFVDCGFACGRFDGVV